MKIEKHSSGIYIYREERLGLDIGAYKFINGSLSIINMEKYEKVKLFMDYFDKRSYAEAKSIGNLIKTLPKLTTKMVLN